jgi:predicted DNA-binding protein YlxM (UPF0122 family)
MTEVPIRERVEELLNSGRTVIEIAQQLRISQQAVYKTIHRYGLPLPSERK